MRKLSLLQLAHAPWSNCSGAHKSVRNRTDSNRAPMRPMRADVKNPMKLLWPAPLASRMLIP